MQIFSSEINTNENKALSVSDAMSVAKVALESIVVSIVGEVSEFSSNPRYKAVYFTIKDEKSSLPCMMWANKYNTCGIDIKIGNLVQITGRFSLYAAKGRMNFDVFSIELAGEGKLRMQVSQLAKRLQSEGLMEPFLKKQLPEFPQKIGIVTSPRGAAIYDVLRTLRRRYPIAKVYVAGVTVEGKNASTEISLGLDAVANADVNVILLVRGGGSFEDLMPFNDESLARKIASIQIPIVTGIGHEPDTTIADMVADHRASTPTAAAETVVSSVEEISSLLNSSSYRLKAVIKDRISFCTSALELLSKSSVLKDPLRQLKQDATALDELMMRLPIAFDRNIFPLKTRISTIAAYLEALSPLSVLHRGYSIARNEDGTILKNVSSIACGDKISVQLNKGLLDCSVNSVSEIYYSEVNNDKS